HDQVGRSEHEHHGGDEIGALLEERLGHGRGRVGATGRHHSEDAGPGHGCRAVIAHDALHLLLGNERLHRTRETEAEDQRPERLPEHEEALAQAVPDVYQDRTSRAIAADASATLASASGPPPATASRTQWSRWSSSSSSA